MYNTPARRSGLGSFSTPSARSRGGTPYRGGNKTPLPKEAVPDGPISDFCIIIQTTPTEEWQKRTTALSTLVAAIPSGSEYAVEPGGSWYNNPPTLRHLANPLSQLLKDPRSTVVKRTCESMTELFAKCQVDARYLLKDMMPHILAVHAQTVQVIRSYVQSMVVESLAVVPCKMAMPLWLDRLKSDKAKTVREACSLYLSVGLAEWDSYNETYLTPEIWTQVGTALIKALRDPSPITRSNAKRGLETVQGRQPQIFEKLMGDADLVKDVRVKKMLARIQSGESAGDDISVASSRAYGGGGGSVGSRSIGGGYGHGGSSISGRSQFSERYGGPAGNRRSPSHGGYGARGTLGVPPRATGIPMNIAVSTPVQTKPGANSGSPRYLNATASSRGSNRSRAGTSGLGPPQRIVAPFRKVVETPTRPTSSSRNGHQTHIPTPYDKQSVPIMTTSTIGEPREVVNLVTASSFDSTDSPTPVIASKEDLSEVASKRAQKSRRSSWLQERFARSSSDIGPTAETSDAMLDDLLNSTEAQGATTKPDNSSSTIDSRGEEPKLLDARALFRQPEPPTNTGSGNVNTSRPEHILIANELLEAHKNHVDQIMETLKIEMDALKDFEQVLLAAEDTSPTNVASAKMTVTEEDVLEYFESIGLCLDQRTSAGNSLRRAMDQISKGGGSNGAGANGEN